MKVVISDTTICEENGQYSRTWEFECGCKVFGTFAGVSGAFRRIGIFYCKNHEALVEKLEEEFGCADLVWEDELMDFMKEEMGEELEFE